MHVSLDNGFWGHFGPAALDLHLERDGLISLRRVILLDREQNRLLDIFIDREAREIMYLVASVRPSVCPSVCLSVRLSVCALL